MTQPKHYEFTAAEREKALAALRPLPDTWDGVEGQNIYVQAGARLHLDHVARWQLARANARQHVAKAESAQPAQARKLTVESTAVRTLIKKSA